jgi:hypothetical protein
MKAIEDYRRFSGNEHIQTSSFLEWASMYGVSAIIIDGSVTSTKFSYILSKNGVQEESGTFDFWPDAISDMVSKILEYVEPFVNSIEETDRYVYEAHILKASNLCAELIAMVSHKQYIKAESDMLVKEIMFNLKSALK